jgi:hypothetical protein
MEHTQLSPLTAHDVPTREDVRRDIFYFDDICGRWSITTEADFGDASILGGRLETDDGRLSEADTRRVIALARSEVWRLDDRRKRSAGADPHVGRICNALFLELEGDPVVDVISNVLLVGQHLVHGAPRPGPPEVGQRAFIVEDGGDLAFGATFIDEHSVHAPNVFDLGCRARYQDNSIGLEALLSATRELALRLSLFVDKLPS